MAQTDISEARLEISAGKPVELPGGDFVANARMTREGADLHLTSPDGHTVTVEGYFAQETPPDLVTADGSRLSPHMVNAFVPPEHSGQYAASGQIVNDASAAGRIAEVSGDAHIIRADGTRIQATVGTPIYQGDVVETTKTGAVNIEFSDNTTFAISESARMSVDKFVYDTTHQSGSSFFSMLQGVFVYTSGLIGKADPGNVSIDTPVGSIGIRGTVVAGQIFPAGRESKITILDGAITLTNASGTHEMRESFNTVSLNSYQNQPTDLGRMDAQTFSESFHSIASVAGSTLSHFSSPAAHAAHAAQGDHPAAAQGNADDTAPAAHGGKEATPAPTGHAPADSAAPLNGMLPDGMPPDGMPMGYASMVGSNIGMGPVTGAYFGGPGSAVNFFGLAPGAPPPTGLYGGTYATATAAYYDSAFLSPLPLPPPPVNTTSNSVGDFRVGFNFANPTAGANIKEFSDVGILIGAVTPFNAASGPISYMLAVNGANLPLQIVPGANGTFTTTNLNYATAFTIDSTGRVFVNNPLALSHFVNPNGLNLTITATDSLGRTVVTNPHFDIENSRPGLSPQIFVGGSSNDVFSVSNISFGYFNGGAGSDTISLTMAGSAANQAVNLASSNLGPVRNIEGFNLGTSGYGFNIGAEAVYRMTDANHTLTITSTSSSFWSKVSVITGPNDLNLVSGAIGTSSSLTYTGTFNGSTVTLIINNAATSGNVNGIRVTDVTRTLVAPTFTFDANSNIAAFPGSFTGVREFASVGTIVGQAILNTGGDTVSYSIASVVATLNAGVIKDITTTAGTLTNAGAAPFSIDSTGVLTVNNPLAMSHFANGGFDVIIAATNSATSQTTYTTIHVLLQNYLSPGGVDTAPAMQNTPTPLSGTAGADFLVNISNSNTLISGGGGADVILTGSGNDSINISNSAFKFIDAGAGNDTLVLGTVSTPLFATPGTVGLNFTSIGGLIKNLENINLGISNNASNGNRIKLDISDVFDMTSAGGRTLTILATGSAVNSAIEVVLSAIGPQAGDTAFTTTDILNALPATVTYSGIYQGALVTLIINNGMNALATAGAVQVIAA